MLIGGINPPREPTADDRALFNHHLLELNAQLQAPHNTSYELHSVSYQVSGQNYFAHLTGVPDAKQYTVTLHEPPIGTGEARIIEVSHGHNPHRHGHS